MTNLGGNRYSLIEMNNNSTLLMEGVLVKDVSLTMESFIYTNGNINVIITDGCQFKSVYRDYGNGGAISGEILCLGHVDIEDCIFDDCVVSGSGGAISLSMSTALFTSF
jgi:hypothetical protein